MKKDLTKIIGLLLFLQLISGGLIAQEPVTEIIFSKERGLYYENFDLTLSTNVSNASIRYTIDGSNPANSLTAIITPAPATIRINPTNITGRDRAPGFIVRACVEQGSVIISKIMTHTYIFPGLIGLLSADGQKPGPGWPEENYSNANQFFNYGMDPDVINDPQYKDQISDALRSIPTLSLVTDLKNLFDADSGIYVNAQYHGAEWERPTSLELINADNSPGFQINAGLRIRGGWSRHNDNPKHAFRVFFRSEYGESKLDFPLFEDEGADKFDKVDLRTSQNYSWSFYGDNLNTMNRDVFSRDLQGETGHAYTRSRYYHLYLNGTYWGLFQTQERSEASFAEQYFGGLREDYDVIKINIGDNWDVYQIEATDGNLDAWRRLWDLCNIGFYTDEDYFKVQGLNTDGSQNPLYEKLVDVDNLIDYMLCTFYVGDFDGPVSNFIGNNGANNFYAIYNRNNPDGFKFLRHDAEHSLLDNPWGYDRTGPFPAGQTFEQFNPQWLHQKLAEHPEYRLRMADKVYKYFFNNGIMTPEASIERFLRRKNEIDQAIIAESARWGDSKIHPPRTRDDHWIPAINHIVEDYFPERTQIVLSQLLQKGWYSDVNVPLFNKSSGIVDNGFELNINADQGTIYYTIDGSDPHTAYSIGSSTSKKLVLNQQVKRIMVPTQSIDDNWKTELDFDVTGWGFSNGLPGGIGYEYDTGYEDFIKYDTGEKMFDDGNNPFANTSCYIRIPFTVSIEELDDFNSLSLRMRYDDGFVAYLNGVEVARALAPLPLEWNSAATENHEASVVETFDLSEHLSLLNDGSNILAIHGLNVSRISSDFLILAELIAGNNIVGPGLSPTAQIYDEPITVSKHSFIRARVLQNGKWSALNEIDLWVEDKLNYLIISEFHYHPLDKDSVNDQELEFIEILNSGSETIDLSQKYFSAGISYSFSSGSSIKPGERIVLAANKLEFKNRYGFEPYGEYTGQLNNGGEAIVLNNITGDTLIYIDYEDKYPWPNSADGSGYSLVLKEENPTLDFKDAKNWIASKTLHGTPGNDEASKLEIDQSQNIKPATYQIYQNYPNPFNAFTKIEYVLPKTSRVKIKIVNITGQTIRTLVNENQSSGYKSVIWDGKNEAGTFVSSGIYIYSMNINNSYFNAKRMLLLK